MLGVLRNLAIVQRQYNRALRLVRESLALCEVLNRPIGIAENLTTNRAELVRAACLYNKVQEVHHVDNPGWAQTVARQTTRRAVSRNGGILDSANGDNPNVMSLAVAGPLPLPLDDPDSLLAVRCHEQSSLVHIDDTHPLIPLITNSRSLRHERHRA